MAHASVRAFTMARSIQSLLFPQQVRARLRAACMASSIQSLHRPRVSCNPTRQRESAAWSARRAASRHSLTPPSWPIADSMRGIISAGSNTAAAGVSANSPPNASLTGSGGVKEAPAGLEAGSSGAFDPGNDPAGATGSRFLGTPGRGATPGPNRQRGAFRARIGSHDPNGRRFETILIFANV